MSLLKNNVVDRVVRWPGHGARSAGIAVVAALLATCHDCPRSLRNGELFSKRMVPPQHGNAVVTERDDYPSLDWNGPLAGCNKTKVKGKAIEYVPQPGYTGHDSLTVEEISPDNDHRQLRVTIDVM